jgi:hypothetical protein
VYCFADPAILDVHLSQRKNRISALRDAYFDSSLDQEVGPLSKRRFTP